MITLDHCMQEAMNLYENNDCGVRALALVCNIPYKTARETLSAHGRKHGAGVFTFQLAKALVEHSNPKPLQTVLKPKGGRYTPKTIGKAYPKGRFLLYSRGHVMAMVDGEILDWAQDRRLRIVAIQEVKI